MRCASSTNWKSNAVDAGYSRGRPLARSSADGRLVLIYGALEAHARATRIGRIYVEASAIAKPLFERRGFVPLGRNDFMLGDVAIFNFRLEKHM